LFNSIDINGDGQVDLREFTQKLERCGLKNLTKPEMLVFSIIKARRQMGMSKSDLFNFINKSSESLISRKDFRDMLSCLKMKEVTD
jgi:Ca2+-binding EF-hand superfamily protein